MPGLACSPTASLLAQPVGPFPGRAQGYSLEAVVVCRVTRPNTLPDRLEGNASAATRGVRCKLFPLGNSLVTNSPHTSSNAAPFFAALRRHPE